MQRYRCRRFVVIVGDVRRSRAVEIVELFDNLLHLFFGWLFAFDECLPFQAQKRLDRVVLAGFVPSRGVLSGETSECQWKESCRTNAFCETHVELGRQRSRVVYQTAQ